MVAQARQREVAHVASVDPNRALGDVVEAREQARNRRLAGAGPSDDRDRLAWAQVEIEVGQDRRAVSVHEVDVGELDVAGALDEVDRARVVDDVGLFVEHFVNPLRAEAAARCPIIITNPSWRKRWHHHEHVRVECGDVTDRRLPVDREVAAVEEHQRLAEPRQVLDDRREPRPDLCLLHVCPLGALGAAREQLQLLGLRGERLHHSHALDVLVDDGGDVGEAGLDQPRHREHPLAHLESGDEDERHRRERDERERHVDRHHQDEGEHDDAALHEDERRLRQIHLHGADVRVGAGDELPRLHAVIERERHAREVLVDDVPEVVLDAVRSPQEQEAG